MARRRFGGRIEDFAVQDGGGGAVEFGMGGTVLFYNAESGGTQFTDLSSDSTGSTPVTGTTTSDGTGGTAPGALVAVWGPDEELAMWASYDGGPRVLLVTTEFADILAQVRTSAAATSSALSAHAALPNPHSTEWGDLANAALDTPSARLNGNVLGWRASDGKMTLLPPSAAAGSVLLNPPTVGGVYVGQVATAPDPAQGPSGNPWLSMQVAYSSGDNNPDTMQFFSTFSGGQKIKTLWFNGNIELRGAPSTPGRVGARFFESYELIGLSTGRFFELSTNPTNTANREPLLGAYGSASSTKPGWIEATRILSALQGVAVGGNFNSLSQLIFRGRKTSSGAPASGTYSVGDIIIDSTGKLYLCTVAGTPGTWVSSSGGGSTSGSWSGLTAGTNITLSTGTNAAGVRKENTSDAATTIRPRGILTVTGTITSGSTVATVPAGFEPAWDQLLIVRDTNAATNRTLTVKTDGTVTTGQGLASGNVLVIDGTSYVLA